MDGFYIFYSQNIWKEGFSIAILDHPEGVFQGKTVVGDANLAPPAPAAGRHLLWMKRKDNWNIWICGS